MKEEQEWDEHWEKVGKGGFGRFLTFYRISILSYSVRMYAEKYFPRNGRFVEAGSGTSQTSVMLKKHKREYIAVDISEKALAEAKKISQISKTVKADINDMPFSNDSIDGIWNLGVMEHFNEAQLRIILKEFSRILKKGRYAVLFWPHSLAPYQIFLKTLTILAKILANKEIVFFPNEPSQIKSVKGVRTLVLSSGFSRCIIKNPISNAFTFMAVVCRK